MQAMLSDNPKETMNLQFITRAESQIVFHKKKHTTAIRLDIVDNGTGIDKKLIDKIFYQLVSGKESGSGLGLSLAQNFITQHNGMIDCSSTPGETKFSIILPIQNNLKINDFKTGLMDTKQVKIVYFFPKMLGKKINYKSVQFNRLIGAMRERYDNRNEYIHLEFLHLNSLFYQPVINNLPLPLRLSKNIFYNFFSSLGVCTYFLPDSLNDNNKIKFTKFIFYFSIMNYLNS